jgi:hypothetical protein
LLSGVVTEQGSISGADRAVAFAGWNQQAGSRLSGDQEASMAVNRPTGDNARRGAVKKRAQLQTRTMGQKTWTKRDKATGEFMDQKKAPASKKYKGVRKER